MARSASNTNGKAVLCDYGINGMIMQAKALLVTVRWPGEARIRVALNSQ